MRIPGTDKIEVEDKATCLAKARSNQTSEAFLSIGEWPFTQIDAAVEHQIECEVDKILRPPV